MDIAERAFHSQPVSTKRLEMRAACHEPDVGARLLQTRAEVSADPTGSDDRDFHE